MIAVRAASNAAGSFDGSEEMIAWANAEVRGANVLVMKKS
jgi:hypothetical protein